MGSFWLGPGTGLAVRQRGEGSAPTPTPTPTPTPASIEPFDFTGGTMSAGAMLTRGSAAWMTGADGRLAQTAADVARFDRTAGGASLRGLMVEPATTNRLVQSQALNAGGWTLVQAGVAPGAGTGPHGAACDLVVELSGAGPHGILQTAAVPAGQGATLSVYARASGRSRGVLRLRGAGVVARTAFDLGAGTATTTSGQGSLLALGGGWFRVATWGPADGASLEAAILLADASGSENYPYTGGGGLFLWGAVLETGEGATSYVASGAAPGARAADRLELDWGARGVPDGAATLRCRFDDGSTEEVAATVAGGRTVLPVPLARAWLRRIEMA